MQNHILLMLWKNILKEKSSHNMKFILSNIKYFVLSSIAGFILYSCDNQETTYQPDISLNADQIKDSLIQANKYLLEKDKELIESYIERRSWDMKITESGLWYQIYDKTEGEPVIPGNIVTYHYSVELPDGTLCYSSDSTGVEKIKIGQSGKESGLEEGLKMMKEGEKARFILPPHMAHGLIGNMDKIPHRSIIVYHIEIVNVIDF